MNAMKMKGQSIHSYVANARTPKREKKITGKKLLKSLRGLRRDRVGTTPEITAAIIKTIQCIFENIHV